MTSTSIPEQYLLLLNQGTGNTEYVWTSDACPIVDHTKLFHPRERSNHVIGSRKRYQNQVQILLMKYFDWKSDDVRTRCQCGMPYHAMLLTWCIWFIWIRHVRAIRQDEWILHRHQTCHSFNWLELFSTDWTYTCIWHSIYYLMHAFGQHNQLSDSFVSFAFLRLDFIAASFFIVLRIQISVVEHPSGRKEGRKRYGIEEKKIDYD